MNQYASTASIPVVVWAHEVDWSGFTYGGVLESLWDDESAKLRQGAPAAPDEHVRRSLAAFHGP